MSNETRRGNPGGRLAAHNNALTRIALTYDEKLPSHDTSRMNHMINQATEEEQQQLLEKLTTLSATTLLMMEDVLLRMRR